MNVAAIITTVAVVWSLIQIYWAGFGFFNVMISRPIHVAFGLALTYLLYTIKGVKKKFDDDVLGARNKLPWYDIVLALLSLSVGFYMIIFADRITTRIPFVEDVFTSDIVVGIILVLLILEAGRRTMGIALPLLAIIFLAYQFLGQNLPGILRHSGITLGQFVDMNLLSPTGIFSTPVGVATDTVYYFLIFAAFLGICGGGKLFIDIATKLTGRFRGGPAKVSVIGSALFGTISGSAVGNVAAVGTFTIPLMKSIGYPPQFAGAVEAVAATGGQLMPPIMGAAAFVMAQFLGMSYAQVALAAAIPAILFYGALFIGVDLKAKEEGLLGIPREALMHLGKDWKKRIHLAIPLVLLIYMIFKGFSLQYSALLATLISIPVAMIRPETRITLKQVIQALEVAAKTSIVVTVPSAVAGIIIGVVIFSGLGMKFSTFLLQISGGYMYPTLFMVMIACLVCGMAMPTTAAYIITSVLMAPALIKIGISPICAHMFIFYFAILSMVTPPVALSAYAGAGIAGADANKTGYQAWFLALNGFIIPYAFVADSSLLLQGTIFGAISTGLVAFAGTFFIAKGLISRGMPMWLRLMFVITGISLIDPRWITDIAGIILGVFCLWIWRPMEKARVPIKNISAEKVEAKS